MRIALCLLVCLSATAQILPFSFGVKAGYVNNNSGGERVLAFTGGPYAEIKLPFLPAIETGVLFKRYEFGKISATVYEVPILVKKRFGPPLVKPFLAAGATLRVLPSLDARHGGATFAAGVTIGLLPVKIEPELRYTRWIDSRFSPRDSQTELLVGFRF